MNTTYSVLMSVYYKENPIWLRESIDSMRKQSIPPSEIVIVKDGPLPAELEEVLQSYKSQEDSLFCIVALEQNMGLGIALQKGILACHNEIIARMDTDDYSNQNRIELQLKAMQEYDADIVSCNVGEFLDDIHDIINYKEVPEKHEEIYRYAKRRNPFNHPAVVFKKSKVLLSGNYQKCDWIEDYDLWVRMLKSGCRGYNIQKPLLLMRVDENTYKRRGGVRYLKSMLSFNWKLWRSHWCTFRDFAVRSSASLFVTLVPNFMRDRIYKKMLRKKIVIWKQL